MPPAGGPGGGTITTGCGGWEESVCPCIVCPFCSPLPVPLTHPFSSPLPTNGSGDQGDQLGAGRGAGRAGRMIRLCTLHGPPLSLRPTPCRSVLSPCAGGEGRSVELSCGLAPSGLVGDKAGALSVHSQPGARPFVVVGCSGAGDCGIAGTGGNCWPARVCIRGGEQGWSHCSVAQVLAVLVMVAVRWARQVRGGERRGAGCPASRGWKFQVGLWSVSWP